MSEWEWDRRVDLVLELLLVVAGGMLSPSSPMAGMGGMLGLGASGGSRAGAGMEGNQNVPPGSGGV